MINHLTGTEEACGWMSYKKFRDDEGEEVAMAAIVDGTVQSQLNPLLKGPSGQQVNGASVLSYNHTQALEPRSKENQPIYLEPPAFLVGLFD